MALFWMFVKSNWKIIAIGLVAASIFGYIGILKHKVTARDEQIKVLNVQVAAEKIHNVALIQSLDKQNASIRAIIAASASQKKIGMVALTKAQKANIGLSEKAKWLENQLAKPDARKKDCSAALREFRHG